MKLLCCGGRGRRDKQTFWKVFQSVRMAEQEFNVALPTLAYVNVLRVCASAGSPKAARFALRIVDGLLVRLRATSTFLLLGWVCLVVFTGSCPRPCASRCAALTASWWAFLPWRTIVICHSLHLMLDVQVCKQKCR